MEQRRDGDQFTAVLTGIRPVPPSVWLHFSEAINHLRAAIDNTVWYLVDQAQGPVDGPAAARVNMPIHSDAKPYKKWCDARRKDGLHALLPDSEVGRRIRQLQPFVDTESAVPSKGAFIASMQGDEVENAHPLVLLQGYSNADKHRAIRVAVTRSASTRFDQPLHGQDLAFKEFQVGQVLASGTWGEIVPIETNTAVMVQRPDPYTAVVPPATELGFLHKYVSQVVVPVLTFGVELPGVVPPQADLTDNGMTDAERLRAGGHEPAKDRLAQETLRMFGEAMGKGWKVPPISGDDAEAEGPRHA
ncbi:hypothetical protein FJ693_05620 [Georgenia yuyongxinii]|uniref:Uncharacterized protein n=1 Tax=Georgenia yuyongxinii TaxID=2589797 RepID=A0A552WUR7_9MICO|nr:hypothetical protein FJ693_05620 [Georgenia yuyongxinii]